jgi:hypothetical protein
MKTLQQSTKDKIIATYNRRNMGTAIEVHDEAKGYCFKCLNGTFQVFGFDIVNELSNLGINVNRSLL